MPIRINLLAEEQAAEDVRRRDPAKRAGVIAALIVAAVLLWSGSLQFGIIRQKQELGRLEGTIQSLTNEYKVVQERMSKLQDARTKLGALNSFSTNRFLWANVLNALQQTTVEDVQLLQFKGEQSYSMTEEIKPSTNDSGRYIPGRPATATEKIVIALEAKDSGPSEGDNMLKYPEVLTKYSAFAELLGRTNKFQLASRSQAQDDPQTGRKTVNFALEARLPERIR